MRRIRLSDPEAVARFAADVVARSLTDRRDASIVLPAGATPLPLYAEFVRRSRSAEIDLAHAHLFQLDEMVGVPASDPRSFHAFLRTHLFDALDRSPGTNHLLDGASDAPAREIARHAAELTSRGGADLVLLGLGQNGHVAFNEPGSAVDDGARVVELDTSTACRLEAGFGGERAPRFGLTLGLREILAARELVLLVTGEAKRDVLRRVLEARENPALPASLLFEHPSLVVVADEPACPATAAGA